MPLPEDQATIPTIIITPAKAVPELAPEPSKAVAAKKGGRTALLGMLALMGGGALDAILPMVTPGVVMDLLGPLFTRYPWLAGIKFILPLALLGALEALRNHRGVSVKAMEVNRAQPGIVTVPDVEVQALVRRVA